MTVTHNLRDSHVSLDVNLRERYLHPNIHLTMFSRQLLPLAAFALATSFLPRAALALDNGLGDLPPMGWNSW